MSKNENKKSSAAQDQPDANTVLEFLYHDPTRIGSFLSQFDPDGHLQLLKRGSGFAQGTSTKDAFTGEGGVPGLGKLGTTTENLNTEGENQNSERTYDPLWANALSLLDFLDQKGLISDNPYQAPIGSFVRVSGFLWIIELGLLKSMLANNTMRKSIRASVSQKQAKGGVSVPPDVELSLELIQVVPHGIQARILGESYWIYLGLNENGLTTSVTDLFLKHGSQVAGVWKAVGILDAQPNHLAVPDPPFGDGIVKTMAQFANNIRPLVGRPNDSFGMTPLVIYRAFSEAASADSASTP